MLAMTCEKRALSGYLDFIGSATDEQWLIYFPFPPKERQTSLRRSVSSYGVSLAIQYFFCFVFTMRYATVYVQIYKCDDAEAILCLGTSLLEVLCCVCRSPFQT